MFTKQLVVPPDVLAERDARGARLVVDAVNHSAYDSVPAGQVALIGRVK